MKATYETYAALSVIVDSGNAAHFWKRDPKTTARFLRRQFRDRDEFVTSDPVLSRLNVKRIQWLALAATLCDGGDVRDLDPFCVLCYR